LGFRRQTSYNTPAIQDRTLETMNGEFGHRETAAIMVNERRAPPGANGHTLVAAIRCECTLAPQGQRV